MLNRRRLFLWFGALLAAPVLPKVLGSAPKSKSLELARKLEFIEKGVRPPIGAAPTLVNEPCSIMPGMITYMNSSNWPKGLVFERDKCLISRS